MRERTGWRGARRAAAWLPALILALPCAAPAQEDAGTGGPSFRPGDVIGIEGLAKLQPWLPPEFWANRDFFFFEGMELEIGPFHRDYAPYCHNNGMDWA